MIPRHRTITGMVGNSNCRWLRGVVIAIAVVIAIVRPFMPMHPVSPQGSYEAIAHLFVGGILGAWLATRERWLLAIAIGLSVVEVLSALIGFIALARI